MIEHRNGAIAARGSGTQKLNLLSALALGIGAILFALPEAALAQTSPFATGASAMQTNILTILTPIAVIGVIALGAAAWFNRISWSWAVGSMVGIALVFGAPQIVSWVRGMFGV